MMLRLAGWALLASSYAICVRDVGWSFSLMDWCGSATAAGLLLVFCLSYKPRLTVLIALIAFRGTKSASSTVISAPRMTLRFASGSWTRNCNVVVNGYSR